MSDDNMQESVVSFGHVGLWSRLPAVRRGGSLLYLRSHLAGLGPLSCSYLSLYGNLLVANVLLGSHCSIFQISKLQWYHPYVYIGIGCT